MNEYVEIRKSQIAGWGGYAKKDISKGTQVIEYTGELITKEESEKRQVGHREKGHLWIMELNKEYDIDPRNGGNEAKFINHSCDANCEFVNYDEEEIWIEAVRDIKKGEELTVNYQFDEPDEDYPCHCGAANCRGWVVTEDYPIEKIKEFEQSLTEKSSEE